MRKNHYIFFSICFLLLTITGCGETVTTEAFLQSYEIRSGTVIEIYNPEGDVRFEGWDGDEIEISAVKTTLYGQEALDKVDININIAGKLVIETVHPAAGEPVKVDFLVKVPGDLLVGIVEGRNGNLTLENVNGSPSLATSNGNIKVTGINGIVSAGTSNGDIEIRGVRSFDDLRTLNGSIIAELAAIHDDLVIRTSNGSISLAIAPRLSFSIEAKTANGTVSPGNLSLDISALDQTTLIGSLNDGGPLVMVSTSNGNIEIMQLQ